jgi:ribonuclease PH
MRVDGRKRDELRPVEIVPNYIAYPEGSVLISMGETKALCNLTIEDSVPHWMRDQGVPGGWITSEYAMLPRATQQRTPREIFRPSGRTQEIRRLIGRSLRAAVDLEKLGPRTCIVDCDVIQADGGTRTAAITGGYVALVIGLNKLIEAGQVPGEVLRSPVAAVSAGVVGDTTLLDLCYAEDSSAEVDVNVVMNSAGDFVEIQGTAEGAPFPRPILNELLDLATGGIQELLDIQNNILNQSPH